MGGLVNLSTTIDALSDIHAFDFLVHHCWGNWTFLRKILDMMKCSLLKPRIQVHIPSWIVKKTRALLFPGVAEFQVRLNAASHEPEWQS